MVSFLGQTKATGANVKSTKSARNHTRFYCALLASSLTLLAGCSSQPSGTGESDGASPIVIGSQDYYSNEIIAEIYAQALESEGHTVDRQFRIGQREAYMPEIEAGSIDLFPEYSGPILQYYSPDTESRLSKDVYNELGNVLPDGVRALDQSPATDQDAYVVTKTFADKWGLKTIDDLEKVTTPLILGANSEAEHRPNGPKGLQDAYGIEVAFTPIEDGGGPLTIKALKDESIQLAIIYTANPSIAKENLVSLEDTKGLFLASHITPLASKNVDDSATQVINQVSADLTPEDLVLLNQRSVEEELPAETIAKDWLAEK